MNYVPIGWQRAFGIIASVTNPAHLQSLRRELSSSTSLITTRKWLQVKRGREGEVVTACCPLAFLTIERLSEDDPERILRPTMLEMDLWKWHNALREVRCFASWWSDSMPGTLEYHKSELKGLLDKILQGRM